MQREGQPEPGGGSLEDHSSVWGMEVVSVKFNSLVPTSATVTCSIFGQNLENEIGYEASRKEPIQYFSWWDVQGPSKALLEHCKWDAEAEAKTAHMKVQNKMLTNGP